MESLMQLFYKWEIQLLVLLSFKLQMFLLFTGSLRRRSNNMLLQLSIWLAYLGADLIAVYALGYISRHEDATIGKDKLPLAFFWAPFLLIHLGGQDTITAFAIEDNNLWLRHLLNLMVQVILALYVFWKSIGWHSVKLLVPGIFVFLVGIIKYGERTCALMRGSLKSLQSSTGHHYEQGLPEVIDGGYHSIVCDALHSMLSVHNIFAARTYYMRTRQVSRPFEVRDIERMPKMMDIQLGMMYDDLYSKALVLRTRSGIILRCISHISGAVAFVLFFVSNKERYSRVDIAITYVLFIGGFLLEFCAIFMMVVTSPWTWAWLGARKYLTFAHISWFLLSSNLGWPEKRPVWSNSMGQYNLVSSLAVRDRPRSCNQRLMMMIRNMMYLAGAEKEKSFWMSKLLDTQYVDVDEEMMTCVVKGVSRLCDEIKNGTDPREWPNLGMLLENTQGYFGEDFGTSILNMHAFTEVHLSKCHPPASDMEANTEAETSRRRYNVTVDVCRKLSSYMIHLLVNQPSMLPLCASVEATLELWEESLKGAGIIGGEKDKGALLCGFDELIKQRLGNSYEPPQSEETLEEIKDVWIGLLLYAAGKSRPEAHAAQLGRGGELLTFAWLLLAHLELGGTGGARMELTNSSGGYLFYVFHLPGRSSQKTNSTSVEAAGCSMEGT